MPTNLSLGARRPAVRAIALILGLTLALMAALGGRTFFTAPLQRAASTGGQGYWLLARDGGVFGFGDAAYLGNNLNTGNDIIGLMPSGSKTGYWTADDDGTIFNYGTAKDLGDRGGSADDLSGFAARPQGDGYWFVSRTGVVTAKGAATKYGEPIVIDGKRTPLPNDKRAVGIVSTPSGNGYWVIGRDGGVFSYGDAKFFGSTGAIKLNQPIVGMAAAPDGLGYWFVASDGGVFNYGSAAFHGSLGSNPPAGGVSGIAATASGKGYWLVGANGKVYPFGDATSYGDLTTINVTPAQPVIGIVATPTATTVDPVTDHQPAASNDTASLDEDGAATVNVLGNDSGLEDAPLTVTVTGAPAQGSASVTAGNAIAYTPAANYNGSDSLTYKVTDADGDTASATLSLSVSAKNDAPQASNSTRATDEGVAKTAFVSGFDVDGNTLKYTIVTNPAHGSVTLNLNTGEYTYTPNAGWTGTDSFTFKVSDGTADSAPATVTMTVSPVNHAPAIDAIENVTVAEDDEGTKVSFSTSDADKDDVVTVTARVAENVKALGLDAAPLSALIQSITVDQAEQLIVIVPNPNANGSATIEVTAFDGASSESTTFEYTVTPVDDPVSAADDSFEVDEDAPADLDVLENDSAVDPGVSVEILSNPAHGTVAVNDDGTVRYSPASDYNGSDSFGYRVTDGNGDNAVATAGITVKPVNDAPTVVSVPETVEIDEDTTSGVLEVVGADIDTPLGDLDGDYSSSNEALVSEDGVNFLGYDSLTGTATFSITPQPDANDGNAGGPATITVVVTDGELTGTASFVVSVNPVNDAPSIGEIGPQEMDEDTELAVPFTVGDIDTDLSGVVVTAGSSDEAIVPTESLVVSPGETAGSYSVRVKPAPDANGEVTIQVTAWDGEATDTQSFTVDVANLDDVVVANDDAVTLTEDVPGNSLLIDVLGNDSGLGDGPISVTVLPEPGVGEAFVNDDGSITYTAPDGFHGVVEFGYEVVDGDADHDTAEITVNVTAKDYTPSIALGGDPGFTIEEDGSLGPLDFELSDPNTSTYDLSLSAASDNESLVDAGSFAFAGVGPDRTLVITPNADAHGTAWITVTVSDGNTFDTYEFELVVTPVDDEPIANDDAASTDEDTPIASIDVLGNDVLGDNPAGGDQPVLVSASPCPPLEGSDGCVPVCAPMDFLCYIGCLINPETCESLGGTRGHVTVNEDNTLSYTPAADFHGTDTIWYSVTDANGDSDWASVTVAVAPVNDTPVAVDDSATVDEDGGPIDIDVLGTDGSGPIIILFDADPEGNDTGIGDEPLTLEIVDGPDHGTASVTPWNTISYQPDADFNGEDTLRYRVTDADGESSEANVVIKVNPVDDTPDGVDDAATTAEDSSVTIDVLGNDSGFGDGGITVAIERPGDGGAVVNDDHTITYTPAADKHGEDSFSYLVSDADGSKDEATVTVTIEPVDDLPVAQDDSLTLTEDSEGGTIAVLANDGGLGDGGLDIAVVDGSGPAGGTVEIEGTSVVYTPTADFAGTDSFSYRVTDGDGDSDEASVSITVSAVNDAPVAANDAEEVADGAASATVDVLENDSDVDNAKGELKVSLTSAPSVPGTLRCSSAGVCTYTSGSEGGITGPVTFTYEVSDPAGLKSSATVTIDIPAPVAPVIEGQLTGVVNTALLGQMDAGNLTPSGEGLSWTIVDQPALGAATINDGGLWTYTYEGAPTVGTDTFTVRVTDSESGLFDEADITITWLNNGEL